MPIAFVLINTEAGAEEEVLKELKGLMKHLSEAHIVYAHTIYGVHDIISRIEAETESFLKQSILEKIRRVPGVTSTITLIVANSKDPDNKGNEKLKSKSKIVEMSSELAARRLKEETQAKTKRIIRKSQPKKQ